MSKPKILVDTCVVVDMLENREPFCEDAQELVIGQINQEYDAFVTASSITDIHYLIKQYLGDEEATLSAIKKICSIFFIADTCASDCRHALTLEGSDFEDNVIIATAMRAQMDCIVTRNLKDFDKSAIPAQLPGEFLMAQDHAL